MRILILSNLHPPHVVDPSNLRVEAVGKALQDRGHQTRVITSALGMGKEYDDRKVYRTFKLNGVYDVPLTTDIDELEEIEQHNNNALAKIIEDFKPELIYIWSLHGLGKSLMLYAAESGIPYTFDIADPWIRKELVSDPWLVHWNSSDVSIGAKLFRFGASLAGSGKKAPKTVMRGKKPVEGLFDEDGNGTNNQAFPFPRLYFCTPTLQRLAMEQDFAVGHAETISPAVSAERFNAEPKAADQTASRFLMVGELTPNCGADDLLDEFHMLCGQDVKASLSIYGQGDSDYVARLRNRIISKEIKAEIKKFNNPNTELPKIYREHDVFVYPSDNAEGWVPGPLQAMASGLPVIINRAFELQDFYVHRQNCLFFDRGDPGLLGGRMLEMIQDGESRHALACNGQSDVLRTYDEATMLDQLETFLEQTVAYWPDHLKAVVV